MDLLMLKIAAFLGASAVGIGAFGAHGLKKMVTPELLEIYETGVRYHFYHAIALLAVAAAAPWLWSSRWTIFACYAWIAGIVIFSGSLYLLTITSQRWLGAITPIGGVALILGWIFLFVAASTSRQSGN